MVAASGMRVRSRLGGFSNPTTPNIPVHQDAGWDLTSSEWQYSSCRVFVPAAMEDAVLFI